MFFSPPQNNGAMANTARKRRHSPSPRRNSSRHRFERERSRSNSMPRSPVHNAHRRRRSSSRYDRSSSRQRDSKRTRQVTPKVMSNIRLGEGARNVDLAKINSFFENRSLTEASRHLLLYMFTYKELTAKGVNASGVAQNGGSPKRSLSPNRMRNFKQICFNRMEGSIENKELYFQKKIINCLNQKMSELRQYRDNNNL